MRGYNIGLIMKLTREQIKSVAREMVASIERQRLVKLLVSPEEAAAMVEKAVTDDLMVEDRLNEEVKDILKAYEREIESGRMDYKTMFDLVKKKLIRERGLIL
jgi:hypothetical protein